VNEVAPSCNEETKKVIWPLMYADKKDWLLFYPRSSAFIGGS
jgi:hypothetical protein